jgi:hypothetical protein
MMGLFGKKKEQKSAITELKCGVDGCDFTSDDSVSMAKHKEWKHSAKVKSPEKGQAVK